jgi:cytochrome c oxidase cbb3-type subunit 4
MDVNDLRGITTIIIMIAFISVCVWAYSSKQKKRFDEAANLPFADDEAENKRHTNSQQEKHRDE